MRFSTLFTLNAIVAALYGLAFLIFPGALASLYGAALGPGGVYVARFFGAVVLGYAVLSWFAKDAVESGARRAIVLGFLVAWALGLVAALTGQLTGAVNALGWSTVLIYLLFTLGYGYFLFVKGSES